MMYEQVLSNITNVYNKMTKSEKKVADYLLQKRGDPQFMSITTFAKECGVADGTIFRFCQTLGHRGYNDFKLALAKAYGREQSTGTLNATSIDVYSTLSLQDSVDATAQKLVALYSSALQQTASLLGTRAVKQAADMILKAKHVYCLGQGGSGIIAMEAWSRFLTVAKHFSNVQDTHLQMIQTSLLSSDEVIWFFTYSGSTKDMLDILVPAKARGVKIILVTRYADSPAARYADVVLICGSNESPLQSGALVAKIAQIYVIDMVYQEYLKLIPHETDQNRDITVAAISNRML